MQWQKYYHYASRQKKEKKRKPPHTTVTRFLDIRITETTYAAEKKFRNLPVYMRKIRNTNRSDTQDCSLYFQWINILSPTAESWSWFS